ncbi:hypothetical protein BTJ45_00341 [Bacillus mycoides]|nr:hypothetical protein BTJ45_00341 [Bacillus mycoides]
MIYWWLCFTFLESKDLLATHKISKECYEGCLVALHNIPLLQ